MTTLSIYRVTSQYVPNGQYVAVGSNGNVIVAPDSGRAAKSQSYNGLAQIVALWADGDNLRNDVEFSFDTPLSPPGTTYSALDSDARDNFKASYHQRIYDLARLT